MKRIQLLARYAFFAVLMAATPAAKARTYSLDFRPEPLPAPSCDAPAAAPDAPGDADGDSGKIASHAIPAESMPDDADGDFAVGDVLAVRLFADEPLEIRLVERTPGPTGEASFLGTLDESDGILDTVVVQGRDGLQMDIQDFRNGRAYTVLSADGAARVTEWRTAVARDCRSLKPEPPVGQPAADGAAAMRSEVRSGSGPAYVDVLVAYDPTAVEWLSAEGGSLGGFANTAVQKMNAALASTGLDSDFRFRLVGTMETGSSALGSLNGAVYAASGQNVSVNGTNVSWPSVRTMRDEVGADIVCVLIDTGTDDGVVGTGYSMDESNRSYFSDSTFSACAIRAVASSHTMTHEVGHNMGAGHTDMGADEGNRGPQLFSYSSGYYFNAGGTAYHTIMAYNSDGYGNYYTAVPYFSSPRHSYAGAAVGDATHDNTLTLASTFAEVAAYRSPAVPDDPPPAPTEVSATDGRYEDRVRVAWDYASGATSFSVYRATSPSGDRTLLGTTTSTSWDDRTAVPETTYWYWVVASNAAGTGGCGGPASGRCTRTIERTVAEGLDARQFRWTTSEAYPWTYTQEVSSDGEDSAQSCGIAGFDTTWIETRIQGPTAVSFEYRKNFYSARFFVEVDGAGVYSDESNAHADPAWRTVSFSIGGGVHAIRIGYTHNGTGYSYEHNGVWVDRFRAPDGTAPPPEEPVRPAPAKYAVRFVANGGTGSMPAQKMACGTAAALAANRFRRTGWIFLGWARTKTGAVAYRDRKPVKDLAKKDGTVTLYAQWAKKAYKVKFYANGGKGKMAAQKMTYGKAARLKANKFKRTGFTFKGWAKSKALAKKGKVAYKNKKKVKSLVKNGKTVKLYAVWKKR